MGPYLAQPITDKHTLKNESNKTKIKYSFSEMQGTLQMNSGWRRNMQDAAIHETDIGDGNSLFAVFDGHGGKQ